MSGTGLRTRALSLLARREHAAAELAEKLGRKEGVDPAEARRVVEELAAEGLVSDERFAEALARDAARSDPRAARRTVAEIAARGVDRAVASRAVAAVWEEEGVDDGALARRAAERHLRRLGDLPLEARRRRLAAYLDRRGFEAAVVLDLVDDLAGPVEP